MLYFFFMDTCFCTILFCWTIVEYASIRVSIINTQICGHGPDVSIGGLGHDPDPLTGCTGGEGRPSNPAPSTLGGEGVESLGAQFTDSCYLEQEGNLFRKPKNTQCAQTDISQNKNTSNSFIKTRLSSLKGAHSTMQCIEKT